MIVPQELAKESHHGEHRVSQGKTAHALVLSVAPRTDSRFLAALPLGMTSVGALAQSPAYVFSTMAET